MDEAIGVSPESFAASKGGDEFLLQPILVEDFVFPAARDAGADEGSGVSVTSSNEGALVGPQGDR